MVPWQSFESRKDFMTSESLRPWRRRGSSPSAASAAAAAGIAAERGQGRGGGGGTGRCRYLLKPLHIRLTIAHAAAKQEFVARLEVLRESHGIAIEKAQLSALLQLLHEAASRRRRCERLLLREAYTVNLTPEALEGEGQTQREFVALYGRQLQAEAGVKGIEPLNEREARRLRILYDVVGVRHVSNNSNQP